MAMFNSSFSELMEFRLGEVVSSNIKRLIKGSGLTTEYLSFHTNLSIPTINRLKAGQHFSVHSLCALAEVLNVDPLSFFKEAEGET